MPRYKPIDFHASMLLPVVLSEQIVPGSFAFALNRLVDHELDLSALDARFKNDEVGASAYDPCVMLKIVLLAYSQGINSSRSIASACLCNVQFIALSGDSQPSHAHIAKFVVSLSDQIQPLFAQVLMTCIAQGLIGREMFTIDGDKLPSNASKEHSGTHEELSHRAGRLEKAPAPEHPSERMRQAIESPRGRQLYSQRIGTEEPVFANLRHNKRLSRLNHRGQTKVRTQWSLYCRVHNIEMLSKAGIGQARWQ